MFPVDEIRFGIALSQIAGTGGVGISVKEGWIQGNRLIERQMLIPGGGPEDGIQPVANTDFCEGAEGCLLGGVILPDRFEKSHHSFLGQVLAVAPYQKVGAGAAADQPVIPGDQQLLCRAAALSGQGAEHFVAGLLHRLGCLLVKLVHSVLYLSIR